MRHIVRTTIVWAIALVFTADSAQGADYVDFHVESKVFEVNGSPKPVCEVTTLFRSGFVYDFLRHPEIKDPETTIFDPFKGRLVVIDPERKLWTEVSAAEIQDFTSKLRIEAAGHADGLLNFLAAPKFKETTENGQTVLTSAFIVYKLKTVPAKNAQASHEYAEFSHWFAQLNVMVKPGQLPPFARLKINEMLEERQLLPTEVQLTIEPKERGSRTMTLRAEHRFQWTLLEDDRQKIQTAEKQLAIFRYVTLEDYNHRLDRTASGKQPPKSAKK